MPILSKVSITWTKLKQRIRPSPTNKLDQIPTITKGTNQQFIDTAMTTTSAALAPINTILNVDILWKIFEESIAMSNDDLGRPEEYSFPDEHAKKQKDEENSPLTTLRRTSQVCHLWRECILGSFVLWGRVIDLDVLMWERREPWRTEVLKRAGQAPLHVFGTLRMDEKSSEDFFKRLLDERWSSIRKLSVAIPEMRDDDLKFTPTQLWAPLQRPSPNLEVFQLFFDESDDGEYPELDLPLFAHTAPALYDFAMHETLSSFSLQAPWLKQLRELELNNVSDIDAAEFITALSAMPFLEGLYINELGFEPEDDEHPQSRLSLNSLKRLEILDTFESSLFVLKNITLPLKCVLFLEVFDHIERGDLPKADIKDLCRELSSYMKNYLANKESIQSISLALYRNKLSFDFPHWIKPRTSGHSHMFTFDFTLPSAFVSNVLKVLFDPQLFAHIQEFIVETYRDVGMKPRILNQLAMFWSSLSSVTTLTIWCLELDDLLVIQEKYPDIFPSLQTLIFRNQANPTTIQHFLAFMLKRVDAGRPMTMLKLPNISPKMTIAELSHLDVVQGLKVIWGSEMSNNKYEYVCGSGTKDSQKRAEAEVA